MPKLKEEDAANHCLTDIFLSSACLSIKSSESLFRYLQILPEHIKKYIFKQPHGPSQLARMLNVTRETLRKWKNKNNTPS
jgi:DNA-binding transcriptional regulator YiaG